MAEIIRAASISHHRRTLPAAAERAVLVPPPGGHADIAPPLPAERAIDLSGVGKPLRETQHAVTPPAPPPIDPAATAAAAAAAAAAQQQMQVHRAALQAEYETRSAALEQEFSALRERLAAQEEAQRLEQEAALEAARETGYRDGYESGKQTAQDELEQLAARLRTLDQRIADTLAAGVAGIENVAAEIVFDAVCSVLGEALLQPDAIRAQVRSVAARVHGRDPLTVRLHPHDLALLGEQAALSSPGVTWEADDALSVGGCVIASGGGEFDARLDQVLQRHLDALRAARG
ncbi:MAG TPA: FliH/SctL family protein [Burkholderiaceae bacterium]